MRTETTIRPVPSANAIHTDLNFLLLLSAENETQHVTSVPIVRRPETAAANAGSQEAKHPF